MDFIAYCETCKTFFKEENARRTQKGLFIKSKCLSCYQNRIKTTKRTAFYEKLKELNTSRRTELAIRLGGKCQKCGYCKCLSALHFHHKEGEKKEIEISKLENNTTWFKAQEELDKCDLLCANCHTEVHASLQIERAASNL